MILGFLGPAGTLICGFEYTNLLSKAQEKPQLIFGNLIFINSQTLEIDKFGNWERWEVNLMETNFGKGKSNNHGV